MASKKKSDKGSKVAAGQILSKFLRTIAEEMTEFEKNGEGEEVIVSKAEALARRIWKAALGYSETTVEGKGNRVTRTHPPDKVLMGLLYERLEGRAPLAGMGDSGKQTIPDRVDDQAKFRITQAGEMNDSNK
jgi:hypothetical protein